MLLGIHAERRTALELLGALPATLRRRTVAADKAYDTRDFVAGCRELGVTPHVAQNIGDRRSSAIDGRTTRHPGHQVSLRLRKRIEEPFGWMKTVAGGRKLRYRGCWRNRAWFLMTGAAYNLLRIGRSTRRQAEDRRGDGPGGDPGGPPAVGVGPDTPPTHPATHRDQRSPGGSSRDATSAPC